MAPPIISKGTAESQRAGQVDNNLETNSKQPAITQAPQPSSIPAQESQVGPAVGPQEPAQVLSRMDAASTALAQDNVRLQSQETDLVGADMAKTATDLSQAQVTQNALMAAAGKVSQYTLFDFLK